MNAVAWTGTALIVASRVLLIQGQMAPGFVFAAVGSICWIVYAVKNRMWALFVVDVVMACMDTYGAIKWALLGQL